MTSGAAVALVLAGAVLPANASAAPPDFMPGKPLVATGYALGARKVHELCAPLVPGDRVEWRFEAGAPLDFNIHYHEGKVVVMPVTLDGVREGSGVFSVLQAQAYCLMWEAGAQDTSLDYRVLLRRGPK